MIILWVALGLVVLFIAEIVLHRVFISRIPVRILIGGTTGRTAVARIIAFVLKGRGDKVAGDEVIGFGGLLRPSKADALVAVCPYSSPMLCTLYMKRVRPTISIVTNSSEKKYETLSVPEGQNFYTSDTRFLGDMRANLVAKGVSEREKNEALALKVLADLGIDEKQSLSFLSLRETDPALLGPFEVEGKQVINACDSSDIKAAREILSSMDCSKGFTVLLGSSDLIDDQLGDYAKLFTDFGCSLVVVLGKTAPKQARILANNVLGCKIRLFKGTDSELLGLCENQIICIGVMEDRILSFLRYCRENGTES